MKLKKVFFLGLFLVLSFSYEVKAQSELTEIVRFEIDGKEVRKNYKAFFLLDGKLVESRKTSVGFLIPTELKNREHLSVSITFGKYRLEFSEIHISKFSEKWIVGIDNKPFSDEIDYLVEDEEIKRANYIHFKGCALETRRVVWEK